MTKKQIFSTLRLFSYLVILSFTRKLIAIIGMCFVVALRIARMIYEPQPLDKPE